MNKKDCFDKVYIIDIPVSSNIICIVCKPHYMAISTFVFATKIRGDDMSPGLPRRPLQTVTVIPISQTVIFLIVEE